MPNYTINRLQESHHVYGCTNWETTQQEGQQAGFNTALDATVVWEITANPGFVVQLDDFDIPNTQPTSVTQTSSYRTFVNDGGGLPSPINGVVMEQVSSTLIKVAIFLYPSTSDGIIGPVFQMPANDVSLSISIKGCAKVAGEGVLGRFVKPDSRLVVTNLVLNRQLQDLIVHNELDSTTDEIHGKLAPTDVGEVFLKENYIMSYEVKVVPGYRFAIAPKLDFDEVDYYYKSKVEYTRNPHTKHESQDITGIVFDIYKKR